MNSNSSLNFPESCVIKAQEIKILNQKPVFIDATFVLPGSEENIHENFEKERLPDAVFFDIEAISDQSSHLPHMLPNTTFFEEKISELGIKNDDLLIIYGQHGMIMGPARVWWTFRYFGHDKILVLDGGLPAWKAAGLSLETDKPKNRQPSDYKIKKERKHLASNIETVRSVSCGCTYPVLDARPAARFSGASPEPREKMRSGHIPGSLNLPCSSLVKQDGTFKEKNEIIQLVNQCGIDLQNEPPERVILSCGSGITACALALALHYAGYYNTSVYDGSWSEWGHEDTNTDVATS
ncbi:MAG: sulfurtransferase [Alphaproteobacteria bacterium]|nr:sulfurtransferase [Alphaproteobacteria bacterium]